MVETSRKLHPITLSRVLIEPRPSTDPELATLIVAQQRELRPVTGGPEGRPGGPVFEARYLVGVVGGRAMACGGVRTIAPDTAEITGMFVRPAFRRQGLARQLLSALEDLAFQLGHGVLRLAVDRELPDATGLYAAAGYVPQPAGGTVRSYFRSPVCLEKSLTVTGECRPLALSRNEWLSHAE